MQNFKVIIVEDVPLELKGTVGIVKNDIPEAEIIGTDEDNISIKATTTEKLGFTGREEGMSAYATVLITKED